MKEIAAGERVKRPAPREGRVHHEQARGHAGRDRRRQRSCFDKLRIPKRRDAEARAAEARERSGDVIVAYRCRVCGDFHTGHERLRRMATLERYAAVARRFGGAIDHLRIAGYEDGD